MKYEDFGIMPDVLAVQMGEALSEVAALLTTLDDDQRAMLGRVMQACLETGMAQGRAEMRKKADH